MTAQVVQLFVNSRRGWLARRRIAALRSAFEDAGATVLIDGSLSDRLEIDPRSTDVCAVGGDGTVRHVIDAVHRSGRPLTVSVYPAGTVNLLSRECGYPRAPRAFVRRVLDAGARTQNYTGLIGGTPLITCASVGPDSFAVETVSTSLKSMIGRAAYMVAFCKLLIRWPRPKMTLSSGQKRLECEAVYVAKGHFFAGPWTVAPEAHVTDPLLHVVAIERASRRRFVRFAWQLLRGRPVAALDGVHSFRCTELTIDGKADVPLQGDGDIVTHLPASISMRPAPTEFA
jgi:diacylglycerol kinase (ATP)